MKKFIRESIRLNLFSVPKNYQGEIMKQILFGVIIYFSIFGCSDPVSPDMEGIIYFNSFENESDFENWEGICSDNWRTDTPNKKSKKSVFISGGCVVPHTLFIFENSLSQGYYTVECWGKANPKTFGGEVSLKY
jgi:hypothetical protein